LVNFEIVFFCFLLLYYFVLFLFGTFLVSWDRTSFDVWVWVVDAVDEDEAKAAGLDQHSEFYCIFTSVM
jgi:hypothetical protein